MPPSVLLDFQNLNNQLVLSWTNAGFNLQSAPTVTGPFTDLPAATSPYTNSLAAPQQFFRLVSDGLGAHSSSGVAGRAARPAL